MGINIALLLAIPLLKPRSYHYILALILRPGTSSETRPSLLYEGLHVGLFINDVVQWCFASILPYGVAGVCAGRHLLSEAVLPIITWNNISFV